MKQTLTSVIAICALAGFTAPAFADCQEELAELRSTAQSGTDGGIAKDGSLAPLEDGSQDVSDAVDADTADTSDSTTDMAAGAGEGETDDGDNEIAKDGSQAPLDSDDSNVATSGQEAAAQQDGTAGTADETAAGGMSQDAQDALERAEAALAAGDEAGCMEAVEEARTL